MSSHVSVDLSEFLKLFTSALIFVKLFLKGKKQISILYSQVHCVQPVSLTNQQQISCFKEKEIWCLVVFAAFLIKKLLQEEWILQGLFGFYYFNNQSSEFTSVMNYYKNRQKGTGGKKTQRLFKTWSLSHSFKIVSISSLEYTKAFPVVLKKQNNLLCRVANRKKIHFRKRRRANSYLVFLN